jgi:hypothetical protein
LRAAHGRDGLRGQDLEALPAGSRRCINENGAVPQADCVWLAIPIPIDEIVVGSCLGLDGQPVTTAQNLPLWSWRSLQRTPDVLCLRLSRKKQASKKDRQNVPDGRKVDCRAVRPIPCHDVTPPPKDRPFCRRA